MYNIRDKISNYAQRVNFFSTYKSTYKKFFNVLIFCWNLWKRRIHTREKTTLYLLCYTCKNYARTFIFYRKGWAKPLAITNDARRASAIEKVRGAFILACFSFPFTDLSLSFSRSLPSTFAFDRKRERKREADFRLEGNEYFYLLFCMRTRIKD